MADKIPVKATYSGANVVGLSEYLTGDTVPVLNGGTGTTTSTGTGSVVLSNNPTISNLSTSAFSITDSSIVFEGATVDLFETTLSITDPTADRTVTFQDLTGTVGLSTNKLSFFSATSSSELAGVISDETGSGLLVFGTSPNFTTSITTGSSSFDAFNTNATTVNAFGAATALTIGSATSATVTVRPGTVVGSNTTQNLFNTVATTLNIGGAATTLSVGSSTGTTTVNNNLAVTGTSTLTGNTSVTGTVTVTGSLAANGGITVDTSNFTVDGSTGAVATASTLSVGSNATITGDLAVNGGDVTTTSVGTATLFNTNATTLNIGGAATVVSIGSASGSTTVNNNMVVTGNLTVNGTTTTVNSTTITVDDITLELGSVATPSDVTASGGGIVLKGATDKTLTWSTLGWTSSEDFNLVTGKQYEINGTSVLSSTTLGSGVTASSLTSVGTIGTGVWQGTVITSTYGGTGVNNAGRTITLNTGNLTLTAQAAGSSVTVPSTGTLATLAGAETLTNKTLTTPIISSISNTGTITVPTTTGTLALLGDTHYIGTTAVTLNRASANLALTGISSVAFPGSTSGTITVTPAATAGTTAITIPATTGTLVTTGDTGTVTSTMILDGTIVNADINASAGIVDTKLATIATAGKVSNSATTAASANTASAIVARDASGNFTAGTITAALSGNATSATNIAGGAANRIPYNTGSGATTFVAAPTTSDTVLKWTGYGFTWASAAGIQTTDTLQVYNLGVARTPFTSVEDTGNIKAYDLWLNNGGTYDAKIAPTSLTAHRTFTLPDLSGTFLTSGDTATSVRFGSLGIGTAASGTAGEIRATNQITAFYSDERLKTDILPIPDALNKVMQLRGVTFRANSLAESFGYSSEKEQVGVIAQDVKKVLPQIVVPAPFDIMINDENTEISRSGENYLTVHYDKIVPLLIEAIKEQQKQIEELKAKVGN